MRSGPLMSVAATVIALGVIAASTCLLREPHAGLYDAAQAQRPPPGATWAKVALLRHEVQDAIVRAAMASLVRRVRGLARSA